MSEETVSPNPDEASKTEESGQAEVSASPPASDQADEKAANATAAGASGIAADAATPAKTGESAAGAEAGSEDAGQVPTGAPFEGDISMRRSPWKSSWVAIQYVQRAAKTDAVQIRTSDRLTIIALLFFCSALVLSLVYTPLHEFRFALMCCCDVILGTCVVLFLVYRIGIISAMNTRQALITWQMMMGCVLLGIFLCLNTIFAIAYLVETFFPHPLLQ